MAVWSSGSPYSLVLDWTSIGRLSLVGLWEHFLIKKAPPPQQKERIACRPPEQKRLTPPHPPKNIFGLTTLNGCVGWKIRHVALFGRGSFPAKDHQWGVLAPKLCTTIVWQNVSALNQGSVKMFKVLGSYSKIKCLKPGKG